MSFFGHPMLPEGDSFGNLHRNSNDILGNHFNTSSIMIDAAAQETEALKLTSRIKVGEDDGFGIVAQLSSEMNHKEVLLRAGYSGGAERTLFVKTSYDGMVSAYGLAIMRKFEDKKIIIGTRAKIGSLKTQVEASDEGIVLTSCYFRLFRPVGFGFEFLYHLKLKTKGFSVGGKVETGNVEISSHVSHIGDIVLAANTKHGNSDLGLKVTRNIITKENGVQAIRSTYYKDRFQCNL